MTKTPLANNCPTGNFGLAFVGPEGNADLSVFNKPTKFLVGSSVNVQVILLLTAEKH